jgi:MFS family permease
LNTSNPRRGLVLLICCSSLFLVAMNITIVNVALPAIQREFGASMSGLQWSLDGYTLVCASFLMLAGSTADRVGRKKVFQIGLVLFSVWVRFCAACPRPRPRSFCVGHSKR